MESKVVKAIIRFLSLLMYSILGTSCFIEALVRFIVYPIYWVCTGKEVYDFYSENISNELIVKLTNYLNRL